MGFLYFMAYCYTVWLLFLICMALQMAWMRLPDFVKALAIPAVLTMIVLDIGLNLLVIFLFLDLPREWTFSGRMGRYKHGEDGLRKRIAMWVCANLLDPFEIGGHCR